MKIRFIIIFVSICMASYGQKSDIVNTPSDSILNIKILNTWGKVKNLNVDLKTFNVADNPPVLGLAGSFEFGREIHKKKMTPDSSIILYSQSLKISAKGNFTFHNSIRPLDYSEAKIDYNWTRDYFGKQNKLLKKAKEADAPSWEENATTSEENKADSLMRLMPKYNYTSFSISPKLAMEFNQDFSKTQFAPGCFAVFHADLYKSSPWNLFDYPFALLRFISGTDKEWSVSPSLPSLLAGFDYVKPFNDSIRNNLIENSKPYPRMRFEASFKTVVIQTEKEHIDFVADYRYYRELNAPQAIRDAHLAEYSYFVMALQSTNGFFVSYATGKLPFDAVNDEVYSIGFNYKF